MQRLCGYALSAEERAAIEEVWSVFESDAAGVAVCTASFEVAHRHAFVVGACGGFERVKFEGTPSSVAAFVQRLSADAEPGMFRLDSARAPLDQTVTTPLFSTRHVENPDLLVLIVEPALFSVFNNQVTSRVRRLAVGRPVLLLCWWYPHGDELLKVALHDLFGAKNIFSPSPERTPRLCAGCAVRPVDASGGASANHQLLRAAGDMLVQNIKKMVQNAHQANFDAAFNLLKAVHNTIATMSRCHTTLDATFHDGDCVLIVTEFSSIHDHLVRSFRKQTRFTYAVVTKASVLDPTKFLEGVSSLRPAPGQAVKVVFADTFFVERELEMCLHLVLERFPVSSADVFTWTCDAAVCVSRDWATAPARDVVLRALKCFVVS
jgi:hypothetical protein